MAKDKKSGTGWKVFLVLFMVFGVIATLVLVLLAWVIPSWYQAWYGGTACGSALSCLGWGVPLAVAQGFFKWVVPFLLLLGAISSLLAISFFGGKKKGD